MTTVGDIGQVSLGRQRSPRHHIGNHMRPYLRVKNVFEDRIDVSDVMEMNFTPEEFERYKLVPGDILLNEGQSPELIGRPAMYRGEVSGACFTNSLIRFRAGPGIERAFALYLFRHYLHSGRFRREARITTNIAHLSAGRFASIEVALPPLAEQRRIVAALEEHLSRLDAVTTASRALIRRLGALRRAGLAGLPEDAARSPVAELLAKNIGGTWGSPPGASDVDVRVIRVTELRSNGVIDPSTAVIRSVTRAQLESRQLRGSDLLIEKSGGSTDRPVGRVGWVPNLAGPSVCANFMQLLRVNVEAADPRYVFYWLLRLHTFGVADRYQRATTNIRNLKTQDFLREEIPLPDRIRQSVLASRLDDLFTAVARLEAQVEASLRMVKRLRRSILESAFAGDLVPQRPDDETANILLERIAAESKAAPKQTRKREAKAPA